MIMRKNGNPDRNPARIYAIILKAGVDGIDKRDLMRPIGDVRADALLVSLEAQGFRLCERDNRVYAMEAFAYPDPGYNRDRDYYINRYR